MKKPPEKFIAVESPQELKARAARIARRLAKMYPSPQSALDWEDPFQLLVSTILSAQCTDVAVNKATPDLFAAFSDPPRMAAATHGQIEERIKRLGLFRNKARSIKAASEALLERHEGRVPQSMEELTALPGVGRKTAHCVRAWAFGLPGLTVDTHMIRLTARWELTPFTQPEKIERALEVLLPPAKWTAFSHGTILHGRAICHARKPRCTECPILPDCPFGQRSGAS